MAPLPVVKRKRNVLNIEDKVKIINEHLKNNVSVKMIAQKYEVGMQTVYDILKSKDNASQFAVLSDEEIISMADEPERDNVSETTLKEAIEASSTLLNFLDSPGCPGITEQDKIQAYRIQEKLIKENYKLKNIRQTTLHDFF